MHFNLKLGYVEAQRKSKLRGTNFVSANVQSKIHNFCAQRGIKWSFNQPSISQPHGRCVGAHVKIRKTDFESYS